MDRDNKASQQVFVRMFWICNNAMESIRAQTSKEIPFKKFFFSHKSIDMHSSFHGDDTKSEMETGAFNNFILNLTNEKQYNVRET